MVQKGKRSMEIISIFLVAIYSLIHFNLYGQQNDFNVFKSYVPDSSNDLCLIEMKNATRDFKANKFILKLSKPVPFSNTQQRILKSEYHIIAEYPDIFFESCYNFQIKSLLNEKYSVNVINVTKLKADSLDIVGLGTRSQKEIPKGV